MCIRDRVKECVAVPKSKKLLQFTLDDGTGTARTILSGIHSFYEPEELVGKTLIAVSYTHLDVYKRQSGSHPGSNGETDEGRA